MAEGFLIAIKVNYFGNIFLYLKVCCAPFKDFDLFAVFSL